jgi:GxxExxY protein
MNLETTPLWVTTNQTNLTNQSEEDFSAGKIIYKTESYQIVGACFEVYNELGSGFIEGVYQEALAFELRDQAIPFLDQHLLSLRYKSHLLETQYKPDFICFGKIIVEIKAVSRILDEHRAQVHNYLKATRFKLGILVNFGQFPNLIHERIAR